MKNLLKTASGVFAAMPGISVLMSGAMAPPGYSKLFAAFIEIVGVCTLLLVFLNRKTWIKTTAATSRLAVVSGLSALGLLFAYIVLLNFCVVKVEQRGSTYFPLWTSGDLEKAIDRYGSREGVIDKFGEAGAYELVQKQPISIRLATTFILILLACSTTAGLVLCFASLALRVKDKNRTFGELASSKTRD